MQVRTLFWSFEVGPALCPAAVLAFSPLVFVLVKKDDQSAGENMILVY